MPYQTGLPAALAKFGLKVELVSGWKTRGSSAFNPHGAVGHHTAGPKTGDRPSLKVCVDGRPDLNGPLCNTFLPRGLTVSQQKVIVVAAGRANHAGLGGFRGLVGNSSVFGTEAEDDGVDGVWTDWQLWAYPRIMAAQLWIAGNDETWYCSHRSWAPKRKIDPTGISDTWMRNRIHEVRQEVLFGKKDTPAPVLEETMKNQDADLFWNRDIIPVSSTSTAKTNPTWNAANAMGRIFDRANQTYELVKSQNAIINSQSTAIGALTEALKAQSQGSDVKAVTDAFLQKLQDQLKDIKVTVGYDTDNDSPAAS